MNGEEFRDDRCDQRLAGAGSGADAQRCGLFAYLGLRALELGEQGLAALEILAPRVAQRHPARGPLQQPHSEPVLERRDRTADRRNVPLEVLRGLGKALPAGDLDEGVELLVPVHLIIANYAIIICILSGLSRGAESIC